MSKFEVHVARLISARRRALLILLSWSSIPRIYSITGDNFKNSVFKVFDSPLQNSKQKVKKSKQKEGKVSNQINNYRDFKHNQVKDRMKKALTIVAKTLKNITI